MTWFVRCVATMALGVSLSACQSYWEPEADFGSTVNGAIRAQAVNPDAPVGNPNAKAHMDGVAAKASVDNYQKSYISPRTSGQQGSANSVISINNGVGSTGSSGGITGLQ